MSAWFPDLKYNAQEIGKWALAGAPVPPPPIVKQIQLAAYCMSSGYKRFVETGTYLGWTTKAIADLGLQVDTIELAQKHFDNAITNFSAYPNVKVHFGDSGRLLPHILSTIDTPAVFWLDGHFSGGDTALGDTPTPIELELSHIERHPIKSHIVFCDDIRGFGVNGYPTVDWTIAKLKAINPDLVSILRNDSLICASPAQHEAALACSEDTVKRLMA
jgi:hypothetical protein